LIILLHIMLQVLLVCLMLLHSAARLAWHRPDKHFGCGR
jgi:hypothetical protein